MGMGTSVLVCDLHADHLQPASIILPFVVQLSVSNEVRDMQESKES